MTTALAASLIRRIAAYVASPVLLGALSFGCAAPTDDAAEEEQTGKAEQAVVNGFFTAEFGSTADAVGLPLGLTADQSCFLNGVSGNLNEGDRFGGPASRPAIAGVFGSTLFGSGGAHSGLQNQRVWPNRPVKAGATCVGHVPVKIEAWQGGGLPRKITDLGGANRQCFLQAVSGVDFSWSNPGVFAQVFKATTPDATHPTAGWYVQSNAPLAYNGSYASVTAACYDFPVGSGFSAGQFAGPATNPLTSGRGMKACGLTFIQGAFNVNSFNDGVTLSVGQTGNWNLTVSAGKIGGAVCVW